MKQLDKAAYKELIEHLTEYKDGIGKDQELPAPKYFSRWCATYGEALITKLKEEMKINEDSADKAWKLYADLNYAQLLAYDSVGRKDLEECFKNGFKARST